MTNEIQTTGDERITGRTITRRGFLATAGLVTAGVGAYGLSGTTAAGEEPMGMMARIENVSTSTTLRTTGMGAEAEQPVPLSPGAYAVHTEDGPIFTTGEPERNNGLEEIAEDGMPTRLASTLKDQEGISTSGAFTTPVGAKEPGPLLPGDTYEFAFEASPGDRLSFVTMFVPSNDLFYAPDEEGIHLFERDGEPVTGEVTDLIELWDAGTEINEEPGVGENQVQRQRGPNVGLVERGTVVPIDEVNGYEYPAVSDVIEVALERSK